MEVLRDKRGLYPRANGRLKSKLMFRPISYIDNIIEPHLALCAAKSFRPLISDTTLIIGVPWSLG